MSSPTAPPETTEMIGGYKVHPAAALLPEPTPEEYERLKDDIKKHGLRVQIVITEDNQILDGRTRARICGELGIDYTSGPCNIEARTTRVAIYDEMEDPVGFVLSMNAARRHLSQEQAAAIWLTHRDPATVKAEAEAGKATRQANLKKGMARKVHVDPSGTGAPQAAKPPVSKSTLKRVKKVARQAPDRLADVAAGKVSAGEVLKAKVPKTVKFKAEPPATQPTTVKAPANKTDLWEGLIRHETPEERRDVVEVLDKAFEFINCGYVRPEVLNDSEDTEDTEYIERMEDIEYHLDELQELLEVPFFSSFPIALTAIEMGAMCLTPAHIKILTEWRDRIDAILLQAKAEPAPAVPEAPGDPAAEP